MSSHLLLHLIVDTKSIQKPSGYFEWGFSSECQEPWTRVYGYRLLMGRPSFPLGGRQLGEGGTQVQGQRPEAFSLPTELHPPPALTTRLPRFSPLPLPCLPTGSPACDLLTHSFTKYLLCVHHEPASFRALGAILKDSEADQTPVPREFMVWEQRVSLSEPQVCCGAAG